MALDTLQLIPALRARWRLALLVWGTILGVVLAVAYLLPPRYEATATLVVEMASTDPIRGAELFKPAGAVSTYLATQVDVIRSEQVARAALRSLGVNEDPAWLDKWREATDGQGDFESWLAGVFLRKLTVKPSRDSNALNVSFTSSHRDFSAAVTNAFVQSYIDASLQMRAGPARQFNSFFEERAQPLRQALEQARARLSAYEQKNGLIVDPQEPDVEGARLAELSAQLVVLQDEATASANRQRQAMSGPGRMQEVRNDPEVAGLMAELAKEEAAMTRLRSHVGERHPEVVQTQKSIVDLRQRLAGAMQRASATLTVPVLANQARVAEARAAIERQRAVVLKRQSQRNAAAALLRDVDNAQKAYDAVLQRASQTALEAANTTQTNISIVKSATPPAMASSLLMINLAVAMLLGPLLGIAAALIRESRDRRLRTVEDVTRLLQQPLLLALPDGYARQRETTRRSVEMQRRLVSLKPRLMGPR